MINRVVADKLRSGRADAITLGELAMLSDVDLQRALPAPLVRACVRSILTPRHGLFYNSSVYLGMIDAFLAGEPVRVVTPEIVARMIELSDAEQIMLDLWAPHWNFFKPSKLVTGPDGSPIVRMVVPYGWLSDEVRTIFGEERNPVVISVEGYGGGTEEIEDLEGNWICLLDVEIEE
jgi:hypothetical protein